LNLNSAGHSILHLFEMISDMMGPTPPKAASFIVTIYGDVVEPRGGVLWMGNLIEVCGHFGISESLVRTAVSRLVNAGQLVGEREGRRSYYRLTKEARSEYLEAARVLFGPASQTSGFKFLFNLSEDKEKQAQSLGFVSIGQGGWIGPDRGTTEGLVSGAVGFAASPEQNSPALHHFLAERWDLKSYADQYEAFIGRCQPLGKRIDGELQLEGATALHLRLAMVHAFRAILLKDPRLPAEFLPEDWAGERAFRLFAKLYRFLSEAADLYIGRVFEDRNGNLPSVTDAVRKRLANL